MVGWHTGASSSSSDSDAPRSDGTQTYLWDVRRSSPVGSGLGSQEPYLTGCATRLGLFSACTHTYVAFADLNPVARPIIWSWSCVKPRATGLAR